MLTADDLQHPHDVEIIRRTVARLPAGANALRREDALLVIDALLAHTRITPCQTSRDRADS
jgi:hypothetical protein